MGQQSYQEARLGFLPRAAGTPLSEGARAEGGHFFSTFTAFHVLQAKPHLKVRGRRELAALGSAFPPARFLHMPKTSAYPLIQATRSAPSLPFTSCRPGLI